MYTRIRFVSELAPYECETSNTFSELSIQMAQGESDQLECTQADNAYHCSHVALVIWGSLEHILLSEIVGYAFHCLKWKSQ